MTQPGDDYVPQAGGDNQWPTSTSPDVFWHILMAQPSSLWPIMVETLNLWLIVADGG